MMHSKCIMFLMFFVVSTLHSSTSNSQLEKNILRYFPKVNLLKPKGFSVTIEGLDKYKYNLFHKDGPSEWRVKRNLNYVSISSSMLEKKYGLLNIKQQNNRLQSKFVLIKDIDDSFIQKSVLVRGRLQTSRTRGKQCFIVLRQQDQTIQCFLQVTASISQQMLKFASNITRESIIDVVGKIQKTSMEIRSCSKKWYEIFVEELWVVSKAESLPIQVVDCARLEKDHKENNIGEVISSDGLSIFVSPDKKLDNRVLDLRTPANQAIFRIESAVGQMFRNILIEKGFLEIHTPKIINTASEGGANVFTVSYFKTSAYLAQSPQLYKQMAIAADFEKVFTIGAVFRAEDSHTSRHLTEFVGLDFEMAIKYDYNEVLDVIENTFIEIFKMLNSKYNREILNIRQQYPSEPFEFIEPSPRIKYSEGMLMLKNSGVFVENNTDLSSQHERLLGKLIKDKYKTDFFILDKYPLSSRPFYTMPDSEIPNLSNSYDVFMRGEEVMSGAQRIHDANILRKSALKHGVDIKKIKSYIDAFRYGCSPHAGGGIGLERTVALFLGLENIRKTSLFPRDPNRLSP